MQTELQHRSRGWDHGAGAAVVAVFGAFALVLVLRYVETAQRYPDFIVGFMAWNDYAKLQDLLVLPALIMAIIGALLAWQAAQGRLDSAGAGLDARAALVEQVLLWSIPAVVSACTVVIGGRADHFLITVSFAGIAAIVAMAGRKSGESGQGVEARSFALLAISLLSLLPLAVSLLGGRFAGTSEGFAGIAAKLSRWAFPAFILVGAVALMKAEGLVRRAVPWMVLLAQAGMLTFFVLLLPAPMMAPDGTIVPFRTSAGLALIVIGVVTLGLLDIGRRLYRHREDLGAAPARLLSPVALFGLVIALRMGSTAGPMVTGDDYHAGEVLVGWWSWLEHGKLAYRDYFPPHGLLADDLPGVLARLLYDGTAASISEARRVFVALTLFAAFLALHWRTKSLLLAFVSTLLFGVIWENTNWVALAAICPFLIDERSSWARFVAWIACGVLLVIAVPAQGVVLVAACAAPMLLFVWGQRGRLTSPVAIRAIVASVLGVAIVAATPLLAMWLGAVRFVLENGTVNQVAWGVPWEVSWNSYSRRSGLFFETLRMSWMALPLAAAGFVALRWRSPEHRPWLLGVAVPVILLFVLLSPYAMGRIDLDAQSRAGLFTNFAWCVIAPLLFFPMVGSRGRAVLLLSIAAIGSALNIAMVARPDLDRAMNPVLHLPMMPVDGAAAGMPNVGRSVVDPNQWKRLQELKRALDGMLPPGAAFLDLTNRQAHQFYMGRPTALATPAPFNNVPLAQQRREVEALRRNPPPVALLEAANQNFDGGSVALRSPLLYRYVLDNYEPELREGFVVARLKAAPSGPGTGLDPDARERALELWDKAFRVENLLKIPSSWGRSWHSLESRVERKTALPAPQPASELAAAGGGGKVSGRKPQLTLDLRPLKIAGRNAGLMGFVFACQGKRADPQLRVSWWGGDESGPSEAASLLFTALDGTAIVPLDAFPRWMATGEAHGLAIGLENPDACASITVREPWLGQRASLAPLP